MRSPANIINYRPELKKNFESLNREWLEKHFTVEDVDQKYFDDPEKEILQKGGEIFFALKDDQVLGTCSLVVEDGHIELAKMAVTSSAQGLGLGCLLMEEALQRARDRGYKKVMLVTNTKLVPAIALYKKFGFKEVFRGQHPKYSRGDLVMEIELEATDH